MRRAESNLRGARGHNLLRRAWLPAEPRGVLLVVHGYAEHSGRYDFFGSWFASRGFAVHAYDQQGHGRSTGVRGHVRRFDDFLDDLEQVRSAVASEHPELPLYLVGHSMGGLVVASFVRERQPEIEGAALSGPALLLGESVPRRRLVAARLLRRIAPRLTLPSGLDLEGLSRDPGVIDAYKQDPLIFERLTASLGAELLDALQRIEGGAGEVRVPMLLLHGEDDPLCPVEGSRAFHARLASSGSALRSYPGLRHEIFNEPEREQVLADLLAWVDER